MGKGRERVGRTKKPATARACSSDSRLLLRAQMSWQPQRNTLRGAAHSAHDAIGIIDVVGDEARLVSDAGQAL